MIATDPESPLSTVSDDVKVRWESNCAGEIFLVSDSEYEGLRIGHFQGDAALAAYIVSMHNAALAAALEDTAPMMPSPPASEETDRRSA